MKMRQGFRQNLEWILLFHLYSMEICMVLEGIKLFIYFINRNDTYKMVVTYQRHHNLE